MAHDFLGSVKHISQAVTPAPAMKGFHHVAYRCRDAEETRQFYEDLLGFTLVAALAFDKDPAGNDRDFMHLFFDAGGGTLIAFFDDPGTVKDDLFTMKDGIEDYHFAFHAGTMDELMAFKDRLAEAKVPVFGPIDHDFCHSIYFFDPNGLACEISTHDATIEDYMAKATNRAPSVMKDWIEKTAAIKSEKLKSFSSK